MPMPDGNTAAEHQYQNSQARAGELYDAHAPAAIASIVDDVLSGRGVAAGYGDRRLYATDFCDGLEVDYDRNDVLALVLETPNCEEVRDRLTDLVERRVRDWCEESVQGSDLVDARCREIQEDQAARYAEKEET